MGLFTKKTDEKPEKKSLLGRMADGLLKTRSELGNKIGKLLSYYDTVDDDFYDELEAILITADMGTTASHIIVESVRNEIKERKLSDTDEIHGLIRNSINGILMQNRTSVCTSYPQLILIVGVNGAGKTTAIGKLACRYTAQGKKVMLAAGDTFRAAAAEQLNIWAERAGAQIVSHGEGADSAAVIFDALSAAQARGCDICLCDTAGRLQNKKNLMDELAKVGRVIKRSWQGEMRTYIVLDATTGQNAVSQVKTFNEAAPLDGIILNKLDGTAKGGVAVAIKQEFDLDVLYAGIGEGKDDLIDFIPEDFASNII